MMHTTVRLVDIAALLGRSRTAERGRERLLLTIFFVDVTELLRLARGFCHDGWVYTHPAMIGSFWKDALCWEVRAEDGYESSGNVMAERCTDCFGAGIWHPVTYPRSC